MALTIDQRLSGDVVVLRARGRITLGEETNSLREAIRGLVETGHRKILLNLEGVTDIDSAGIGTLVTAYSSVRSRGGELKLVGVIERTRDVLQIAKLYTVFDIARSEDEALQGDWSGPRAI